MSGGGLISESYARTELLSTPRPSPSASDAALVNTITAVERHLGPASGIRTIVDIAAIPILELLGFSVTSRANRRDLVVLEAAAGPERAAMIVSLWGTPPDAIHRELVLSGIAADSRWCLFCNGQVVRVVDGRRPWSRQYLEFELRMLALDVQARGLFLTLLHAAALSGADALLDRAVARSARHGVAVCRTLSGGVRQALDAVLLSLHRRQRGRRRRVEPDELLEQSLTVLYRVLFLLFAEARALVPVWDPIYRDRYSIETIVTTLMDGRRYRGIWPALQAISRLAHSGCRAGSLRVAAFNGRLFSPSHVQTIERARIDDDTLASAILAVSTVRHKSTGRQRILYHDLDVEQLGTVYEHLLDYEAAGPALARTGDRRKATGTFYTPRTVTDWLVRRTLEPLVATKTAQEILDLRILDPAMGSGAFLVSACRYLAGAAEAALVSSGEWRACDVTERDRAELRRDAAQRCLYGVDLNPMAVQLARLSLWLAALARDKPLTFLDHHLRAGDSLVGASVFDLQRQPPGRRGATSRPLPLFGHGAFDAMVEAVLPARLRLAREPDTDASVVRGKEALLAAVEHGRARSVWKAALDLWCACWFWDGDPRPDAALYGELHAAITHGSTTLPPATATLWLDGAARIAWQRRFLHWELEFPEVFFDERGRRRADAGFDAIVGNPPWDMIRGDSGDVSVRQTRRTDAAKLAAFARDAGVYSIASRAHANRYQLFVERALQLANTGGRIGLVLPWGAMSDAGAGPMRQRFFDRARVDTVAELDNRRGIFPIHRGLRVALVVATAGTPTGGIAYRPAVSIADELERAPSPERSADIILTRRLLERLSGENDMGIPAIASSADLNILERITATVPRLSSMDGWHAQFGRELNATDDRDSFVAAAGSGTGRVVLEGKQIEPFRVDLGSCRQALRESEDRRCRVPRRARLAHRDVAAATNRLTLIAAIVPARAVTTHTLSVLRAAMPIERQHALCALLNSFVANYLIRMRVSTHVTAALMSRLAVPVPDPETERRLSHLSHVLATAAGAVDSMPEYAELQAIAARLYGLHRSDFEHVLTTFPLIDATVKSHCLDVFTTLL